MNESVKQIESLVVQLRERESRIESLEKELKFLKEEKKKLETETIPDSMSELGAESIQLEDHSIVTVKPFYFARVPDNPEQFFSWLREHDYGGIIKDRVEVWPDAELFELLIEFLQQFRIQYEGKSSIHWKTLEAWYKECVEAGKVLPLELFPNYVGRKAKVK